ncbi:hypothetical protein ACVBEQ_26380 [Nakamurella sp. GG22]
MEQTERLNCDPSEATRPVLNSSNSLLNERLTGSRVNSDRQLDAIAGAERHGALSVLQWTVLSRAGAGDGRVAEGVITWRAP